MLPLIVPTYPSALSVLSGRDYERESVPGLFPSHAESRLLVDPTGEPYWRPATDVFETATHIIAHIDLPGISKSEIKVDLGLNELLVNGTSKNAGGFESATCRVRERQVGKFKKSIQLPNGIKPEDIQAQCTDGLLEVKISKKFALGPMHHIKF
ncbi:hypothetical protein BASA50_009420 [Batrachochytrium salamandrivorans]|uniref:SHSP domain-containing protein n=1 Tax=Batrachochytrium salamandrivorans TaxID=1357716 RepID=A0ABQ8F235_9FUNG|nr:hypothetical protein BASA62_007573 [Batrachochytrium salamandrivorans]KAH6581549.1 hypothetical protein BASA60_002381 [Batrachochytrium salamandrivorans]KAH6590445.1 hypothetical protein BASA50_009420 [Batrachochytrium salamandrivorans]KAH6594113.1 hypothetical protein BASA61_004102 [Batrachochytrium salamandrivorans]KAH9244413.1 hypothetical protein BASA81_018183 [Batrachochytrium salamandrivorans]